MLITASYIKGDGIIVIGTFYGTARPDLREDECAKISVK